MELHAGNDPNWLDQLPELKAGALDYADKILRDLEEAGMLPPPTQKTTLGQWESENEAH